MSEYANSKVQAEVWVTPDQVEALRSACYTIDAEYLQQCSKAIVTAIYDMGLRVGELIRVDVEFLCNNNSGLYLPTEIQKDYPNEHLPPPVMLEHLDNAMRLLSSYLISRWKNTPAPFPLHSSDHISEQGVHNTIREITEKAEIRPFRLDGSRGAPGDVTSHAPRHGIAYRMMNEEEGNSLYDVRNRLRHRGIQTTERICDHLLKM